ncbi:MAG: single-stranded-DNA-specific exonuclease RecJ, partial [Bacteroidetes bacterium]|nr:single-stranded-DNA-specific exonuclease RecJ [Bacteroidota bacterium]
MEKIWKIKACEEEKQADLLANDLNIHKTLATLLVQRGVRTFDEAKAFFRPQLSQLHDPFLMKDMQKAIDRINNAMSKGEKILIYGDYDVDGTTSVALLYNFLSQHYQNIEFYIPDRYKEGYGVSYNGIEYAALNGVSLIISLDCGIKANEKIQFAKDRNIDFIICDHHTPDKTIPNASAVLDPKQSDCQYPYKDLSGCGVGFKFLQGLCQANNYDTAPLFDLLDLLVVSIASDIVPITGENRVMAFYGLKKLNESPGIGLQSIIDIAAMNGKPILIDDIVFKIGPRINAAGRIDSGKQAVELLVARDSAQASKLCSQINIHNQTRKNIDKTITEEALRELRRDPEQLDKYTTVLFNPDWHKGVVGIVASRLIDYFYRPTIILTESNGMATGSARSVDGFDLYQAVNECADLLESYGGHTYAAGLTIKPENVEPFKKRFEEVVQCQITPEQRIPQIDIDAELKFEDITPKFYRILKQFEPFGPQNMKPVFFTENVSDNGQGKVVGADSEHLKLSLVHENQPFKCYPAIAFQFGKYYNKISNGA